MIKRLIKLRRFFLVPLSISYQFSAISHYPALRIHCSTRRTKNSIRTGLVR